MSKIKTIKIEVSKEKEIELTYEEAKNLKNTLDEIFPSTSPNIAPYIPYAPPIISPSLPWYDRNEIFCIGDRDNNSMEGLNG